MDAHGELKVKETTIVGYSINPSLDGISTENEYNTVSVEVKDCSISGFDGDAVEIRGPANKVEIKESDIRDSDLRYLRHRYRQEDYYPRYRH